jgi:hypothetical protein
MLRSQPAATECLLVLEQNLCNSYYYEDVAISELHAKTESHIQCGAATISTTTLGIIGLIASFRIKYTGPNVKLRVIFCYAKCGYSIIC